MWVFILELWVINEEKLQFNTDPEIKHDLAIEFEIYKKLAELFAIKLNNQINLENKKKTVANLEQTLNKVINKEYKVGQSSLYFNKNNNLILNLNLDIPYTPNNEPVKDRTLGVDLGIKYPAYICLSDDTYKRQHLGSIDDFLKVREQMQRRRRNLQQALKVTKGGKGRTKKLQALDRLRENEKNWVKTYNHTMSKQIVEFAKKHKCEYINLEKLDKDGFGDKLLRNWSYYELQNMIEYKAEREGIIVRYNSILNLLWM